MRELYRFYATVCETLWSTIAFQRRVDRYIYKVYTSGVDVFYLYRGQTFVWDGLKAIENRSKHGLSFETACECFFDEWSAFVDASVDDEHRLAVIGLSEQRRLLYVVHVLREGHLIRIISAREATAQERRTYEDGE